MLNVGVSTSVQAFLAAAAGHKNGNVPEKK